MGAEQALLALTAVQGASQGASGFAANRASRREADLMDEQAELIRQETQRDAERKTLEGRRFAARQALSFLKSGVTLEGTPLEVLDFTLNETQREVDAFTRQGQARARLQERRAANLRSSGRASLIGGQLQGGTSILSTLLLGRQAGLFQRKTNLGPPPVPAAPPNP